jgi:hypothetical protein
VPKPWNFLCFSGISSLRLILPFSSLRPPLAAHFPPVSIRTPMSPQARSNTTQAIPEQQPQTSIPAPLVSSLVADANASDGTHTPYAVLQHAHLSTRLRIGARHWASHGHSIHPIAPVCRATPHHPASLLWVGYAISFLVACGDGARGLRFHCLGPCPSTPEHWTPLALFPIPCMAPRRPRIHPPSVTNACNPGLC